MKIAVLDLLTIPKVSAKAWERLFGMQPAIYLCLVVVAALISYAYGFRSNTIFACTANGYNSDRYLAYCNGASYADYEHGAFQFDLEPSAQNFAENADVLFLGNSRLQFGFSTGATAGWFSAASARYYLLGFTYYENVLFAEDLLRQIHPRARVYVINLDDFFDRSESPPVKTILHDPRARHRYEVKRLWQYVHEPICKSFTALCGTKFVIFRSRETGAYYTKGATEWKPTPVSYDQVVGQDAVNRNRATAIDFLSHFAQGKCVILTMVPSVGTKIATAKAVAESVGATLVTPGFIDGLKTFDGYHLDQPSAERWSRAFFQAAGPKIRSCLEKQNVARQ
jgi:hypothetical protein